MRRVSVTPAPRQPDGGYILVAVLSVMLMVAGLSAAATMLLRSTLHGVRIGDHEVAMAGVLRGGLEITAYQLFVTKADPRAINHRGLKFAGATTMPTVTDEASKVDLNGSDPKLLQSLFESAGLDSGSAAGLVARIVAMRPPPPAQQPGTPSQSAGDGTEPTQAQPAQSPQGTSSVPQQSPQSPGAQGPGDQAPGAQAADKKRPRGFQSVDQLRDFSELTADDMRALAPKLTVYNPDGKVNILTASEEVLAAIPGLTRPKAEEIIAKRDEADKDRIASFESMLGEAKNFTKTEPGPAFTVHIEATGRDGRRGLDAVVATSKGQTDPFYILDWRE